MVAIDACFGLICIFFLRVSSSLINAVYLIAPTILFLVNTFVWVRQFNQAQTQTIRATGSIPEPTELPIYQRATVPLLAAPTRPLDAAPADIDGGQPDLFLEKSVRRTARTLTEEFPVNFGLATAPETPSWEMPGDFPTIAMVTRCFSKGTLCYNLCFSLVVPKSTGCVASFGFFFFQPPPPLRPLCFMMIIIIFSRAYVLQIVLCSCVAKAFFFSWYPDITSTFSVGPFA